MRYHSILLSVKLYIGIIILGAFFGCTDKESKIVIVNENTGRRNQKINLFNKELSVYDNTGKLSWDDAFAQSKQVVHTAYIKQIDYSNDRGVKSFYIYQIDEGSFVKSVDTHKIKFPILFLSNQELFKGKMLNDSVYLFLGPLHKYLLLQKNTNIKYEWIYEAPFLKH